MSPDNRALQVSDDALAALLSEWLPSQRWFAGAGAPVDVAVTSRLQVHGTSAGLTVEHVLLTADTAAGPAGYQVYVGWQSALPERLAHAIIGTLPDRVAFDALHDHQLSSLLLSALAGGADLGALRGVPEPDVHIDPAEPGLVIGAEQSNTSIVYGGSVILKVFRRLEPGLNPDAEVHRALHAAGSEHIADPIGVLVGTVGGVATTLGLATRFFANSADGWSMATASVRDLMAEGDLHADEVGGDFAAEAERLGEAVAAVHRDLAAALGTGTMDGAEVADLLAGMADQADRVAARVPALAEHLPAIREIYAAVASTGDLPVQRIHGDLHLGQVLRTLTGWAVIDFEGEPSRPLVERRRPRSPLQDIAGMLRSFDYAAHQLAIAGQSDAQHAYRAGEWSERNRTAFCDGYAAVAGIDPRRAGPMLGAFELAKAVYEVGYEHGHRPTWEHIPIAAVAALVKEAR